jgi:hypothetical protein
MNHELSPLTLEDIRETLSSDPDVLTQDVVNQISKIANEHPWTTESAEFGYGTSDIKMINTNSVGSISTSAIGSLSANAIRSLSASTMGPYIYTTNTTGVNSINPGNFSISNTKFEQNGKMVMKGAEADIEINGKSMRDWMDKIEQRLNILTPNPDLEKEWDDLRRLGERYRKLEKKCQEKSQMWEALKKMRPPKL